MGKALALPVYKLSGTESIGGLQQLRTGRPPNFTVPAVYTFHVNFCFSSNKVLKFSILTLKTVNFYEFVLVE